MSEHSFLHVNDALTTERNRPWGAKERRLSGAADLVKLQRTGDLPKALAERVVKEHRWRRLVETKPNTDYRETLPTAARQTDRYFRGFLSRLCPKFLALRSCTSTGL
jgi:hypothetical protein